MTGRTDIENGIIRAVSAHFEDDPIRALRAARQATQFGFRIESGTRTMMAGMLEEILGEPKERIFGEFKKALAAPRPSVFFRELKEAGLLSVFPEVSALVGKTQLAKYHPEGDAFEHTMLVLDAVAEQTDDLLARFCALAHDFGKGTTPAEMLPRHIDHDKRGAAICRKLPSVIPTKWKRAAEIVCENHMKAQTIRKAGSIVKLAERLHKTHTPFDVFEAVCLSDSSSLRKEHPWWFTKDIMLELASAKADLRQGMTVDEIHEAMHDARIARFVELRKAMKS